MPKQIYLDDIDVLHYFRDRINIQNFYAITDSEINRIRQIKLFYDRDLLKVPDTEEIMAYKVEFVLSKDSFTDIFKTNLENSISIPINRIEFVSRFSYPS
ncbi:hypothetical protein EGI26_03275 [Lacihabitans sp. CCS-44]|nr:hypothetical protein [Lacihabitans sp. CCS-44]